MVVGLGVHPFIITLGTMWMLRGVAFVVSHAESILVPAALTNFAKAPLGLGAALYPVPLLVMLGVTVGRADLSRAHGDGAPRFRRRRQRRRRAGFPGSHVKRIRLGVFVLSGLTRGHRGVSRRGVLRVGDVVRRERVRAVRDRRRRSSAARASPAAKGARSARCSARMLIVMIRQAIRTLHLDQNYEWIIIGGAMIVAVVLDQGGTRLARAPARGRPRGRSHAIFAATHAPRSRHDAASRSTITRLDHWRRRARSPALRRREGQGAATAATPRRPAEARRS